MKILLTAFEPFGGETVNAAQEAVRLVRAPAGVELVKLTVPTVFSLAGERADEAARREKPDAVLCVGQAAGRGAVTPERVAVNLRDASIPDNAGNCPRDEAIEPEGPAAYFSTLPVRAMAEAIRAKGIPAEISNTAGTFVCNDLMYSLLHALAREENAGRRGGFIHVPCLPEQAARRAEGTPSLAVGEIVRALEGALETLAAEGKTP